MSLTQDELFKRLLLMNQYNILANVDEDGRAGWERAAEQVRAFYPLEDLPGADWIVESSRDPFTADHRDLVTDVFAMYEALQHAENEDVVSPKSPATFDGFDGNRETKFMSHARSVVEDEGKWGYLRFSNKDMNAHHPTLDIYGRMLEEWTKHSRPFELNAAEYAAIVAARVHPSNR